MRVRSKLFFLLLLIAVLPLAASAWIDLRILDLLGNRLSARAADLLGEQRAADMRQAVGLAAQTLRVEQDLAETNLDLLAAGASRQLAAPIDGNLEDLLPVGRFAGPGADAPGLGTWELAEAGADGSATKRSRRVAAWRLAPDAVSLDAAGDRVRLAALVPLLRAIHRRRPDRIRGLTVSLETGGHMVFPGHAGDPSDHDPRRQPWYRRAINLDGTVWAAPHLDPVDGTLVFSLARRFAGADGRPAGVVALHVPILGILGTVRDRLSLGADSEAFLVDLAPRADGTDGLRILAHRRYETGDWRNAVRLGWLEGPSGGVFQAMREDIAIGEPGVRRLAYQGRDALWAHAPIRVLGTHLLLVVPFDDILAEVGRAQRLVDEEFNALGTGIALLSLGLILLAVLLGLLGARVITLPVRSLAMAAERLAAGDLEARARVIGKDELGDLARAFNGMVPRLADHLRLSRDIGLAKEVQRDLLPKTAPRLPGLEVAGSSRYCDETGGDYFDFLVAPVLDEGRLAVSVGDVAGHGLQAALLMTTTRALVRAHAARDDSPGALLAGVNRHLCRDVSHGRFVTLFHLEARCAPGASPVVTWADAGQGGAFLYNPAADRTLDLSGEGIPLGILPDAAYVDRGPRALEPGCLIVLGTDGLWESRDPKGRQFGLRRLRDVVRARAGDSAQGILDAVLAATAEFRGGAMQRDDVTLVVLKAR